MFHYRVIVLVGPSGTGKSTVKDLLEARGYVRYGVTCTTRLMRPCETDGRDYDFITPEEFAAAEASGEMAERTEYISNSVSRYGILRKRIEEAEVSAVPTMWILDTNGLAWMRQHFGASEVFGVAFTADREALRMRLEQRDGTAGKRLDRYAEELHLALNACDCAIDTSQRTPEQVADLVLSMMGV